MTHDNEISPGVRIAGLGLWIEKEKALVISDLHLGYEEMLNKQGVMMPRFNFEKIKKTLKQMFRPLGKVEKAIINGDLKHEFGTISDQEWAEVIEMLRFIGRNCGGIVLVKGNHDTILGPIAKWHGLEITDEYYIESEKTLIVHGDKLPEGKNFGKAGRIIIGNEHPAVLLTQGARGEKFKCFLKGEFEGKELIVLPSMNFCAEGTDVLNEGPISPVLKKVNLEEFEAWLVEEKPYYFGKLRGLD